MTSASAKTDANNLQIGTDHSTVMQSKREWEASRQAEEKVQAEINTLLSEREDANAAAKQRIDERTKAIDVMVQATFIVCEKFNRFKDTIECKSIKTRPDVNEPGQPVFPPSPTSKLPVAWGKSSDIAEDKKKSSTYEFGMAKQWTALYDKNEKLEGNTNPENLPMIAVVSRGSRDNEEAMLMEDDSVEENLVSEDEKPNLKTLQDLAKTENLGSKYSLPIVELGIALGEGKKGKTKSIIKILLDVKTLTENEQIEDKLSHLKALESFYKRSWELKEVLDSEEAKQNTLNADMEERRLRMKETQADSEEQWKLLKTQQKVRTEEENRCEIQDEEFGIRDAIRIEDLENISKLISLLRSLYDKRQPKACLVSPITGKMCVNAEHGWCIWNDSETEDQRCSCNAGFYGSTCEKKKCPGAGQGLFEAGKVGTCSDRGTCDPVSGTCKCKARFYSGLKKACEHKHCPASGNGQIDEKCSENGVCDVKRGRCNCKYEWSGDGCQNKKCPNSNSVLYPNTSKNACDGRGACQVKTGKCSCANPYKGKSCELSDCPRDCMSRGGCSENAGKCQCKKGFLGASCEFKTCPDNCGSGGECNRHNGKCICKDGYSGERCRKTTRCPVTMAGGKYHTKEVNWYTIWDKPGWVTCPVGQSLYALRRGLCDALDCLEGGSCAAPCVGESSKTAEVVKIRHCYHDLNVYMSMDKEGWSKCEANYYLGGFYRTGSSLYQLQMFKCCSYEQSRWSQCSDQNWATKFNSVGKATAPAHQWITGLYRNKGHKLRDIDKASTCGFVKGF